MKKLLIILAVCIILCAIPFTTSAERLPDIPYGLPEGENSKDVAHLLPGVDYCEFSVVVCVDYRFDFSGICDEEYNGYECVYTKGGEAFDFLGLKVTEVRLYDSELSPADEWFKDYGYYIHSVTLDSSVKATEALDIIYSQEHASAELDYYVYPEEDKPRDVNADGTINIFDYMLAKSIYFEKVDATEDQIKRADVNKDGKVNVLDMMAIKTYIFNA